MKTNSRLRLARRAIEENPGRGYKGVNRVVCVMCGWAPPFKIQGGNKWRALVAHLEQHIEELVKK